MTEPKPQPDPAEGGRKPCQYCGGEGKTWESDWTGSQHERDCAECMGTGIAQDKTAVEREAETASAQAQAHTELLALAFEVRDHLYAKQDMERCRDIARAAIAKCWEVSK